MNREQRRQAARQSSNPLHGLSALAGQRIPGGCDDCDAYQVIQAADGFTRITVHHDDTCPTLRAMEARR